MNGCISFLGQIILYRLYHNGLMIYNMTPSLTTENVPPLQSPSTPDQQANVIAGQYTVTGLMPYSLHQIRLEACTAKGCSSSETIEARTMEDVPRGTIGLAVRNEGARRIGVQYNEVEVENGEVYYTVYAEGLYYVDIGKKAAWEILGDPVARSHNLGDLQILAFIRPQDHQGSDLSYLSYSNEACFYVRGTMHWHLFAVGATTT